LDGGFDALNRILELVTKSGVRSQAKLAEELGVSQGLVGQMIEELAQRGYLLPVADGCRGLCTDCPLAMTCTVGGPTRVWALTEKGRKAVEK
jgi:predicted ArsR family transcriptional regulator